MSGEKFVTLLNVKEISEWVLSNEELFSPDLQCRSSRFVICGLGATGEEAEKEALQNLSDCCCLDTVSCDEDVAEFIDNLGGREAMRHLWLDDYMNLKMLPSHETLLAFSKRHGLSPLARKELGALFDTCLEPEGGDDAKIMPRPDAVKFSELSSTGATITRMRKEKKLSRAEVADRLGINLSIYTQYELGHALPSEEMLAKIEKCLSTVYVP